MISPVVLAAIIVAYFGGLFVLAQLWQRHLQKNEGDSLIHAALPFPVLLFTYLASLMSTWVFFGGPGGYYRGGLGLFLAEISGYLMFGLVSHFFANKVWLVGRKRNYVTPSDFYAERFNSPVLSLVVSIIMLVSAIPYIISILYAITTAGTIATGGDISYQVMLIGIGIVMILFTCTGFKSVATIDAIQGFFFIAAVFVIAFSLLNATFKGSLSTAISSVWENSNNWFSYPGPDGQTPYALRFSYPLATTVGATFMMPHTFVRACLSGDNMRTQRRLGMAMPVLQVIVWSGCCLIGMLALAKMPGLPTSDTEFVIPYMIQQFIFVEHPLFAQILMVIFVLGAIAVGLSTTNAFLLVSASIIYEDILVKVFKLKKVEKRDRWIVRALLIGMGVICILLSMDPPDLIFTLVLFAMGIVMPLFPVCLLGVYWKKANRPAAIAAVIVGTVINILGYTMFDYGNLWSGVPGMVVSAILMVIISRITKNTDEDMSVVENFFTTMNDSAKEVYDLPKNAS